MKVEVSAQYGKIPDVQLFHSTAIVVDLLRASTCIIFAIKNGATQVIPTTDPGEAAAIAGRLGGRDCMLCGERGGLKLPGFNLGNSPLEYTQQAIGGKTVITSTTNGTNAIHSVRSARKLFIGAMANRSAVAQAALDADQDVIIQCAGTEGRFSADDVLAAGAIVDAMKKNGQIDQMNDLALCACRLYEDYCTGTFDVDDIYHYRRLKKLGFQEDLNICFQQDTTDVVPVYRDGVIVKG